MKNNKSCELCAFKDDMESLQGGLILETDYFLIYHHQSPKPAVAGWLMIIPHRHLTDQTDLSEPELSELTQLQIKFTKILKETTKTERVYWVLFAELTPHIHFHLIPRPESIPPESRGPGIFSYTPETPVSIGEISNICDSIRKLL